MGWGGGIRRNEANKASLQMHWKIVIIMMIIVKRRRIQGYAHKHIAAVPTPMNQGSRSAFTRSAVRSTTTAGAAAFGQQAASGAATGKVAAAAGTLATDGHSAIYAKDVTRHNDGIRIIKKKIRSYIMISSRGSQAGDRGFDMLNSFLVEMVAQTTLSGWLYTSWGTPDRDGSSGSCGKSDV